MAVEVRSVRRLQVPSSYSVEVWQGFCECDNHHVRFRKTTFHTLPKWGFDWANSKLEFIVFTRGVCLPIRASNEGPPARWTSTSLSAPRAHDKVGPKCPTATCQGSPALSFREESWLAAGTKDCFPVPRSTRGWPTKSCHVSYPKVWERLPCCTVASSVREEPLYVAHISSSVLPLNVASPATLSVKGKEDALCVCANTRCTVERLLTTSA